MKMVNTQSYWVSGLCPTLNIVVGVYPQLGDPDVISKSYRRDVDVGFNNHTVILNVQRCTTLFTLVIQAVLVLPETTVGS
jgi:hypothetical protein